VKIRFNFLRVIILYKKTKNAGKNPVKPIPKPIKGVYAPPLGLIKKPIASPKKPVKKPPAIPSINPDTETTARTSENLSLGLI